MKRTAPLLLAATLLSPPGLALAGPLDTLKASLKLKERSGAKKVVVRVELPAEVRKRLKKKRGVVTINVYAGKDADSTKRIKKYKWKLTRPIRKWSFKQKDLCKKGLRHVRIKIKPKARGETFDEIKKTLELDC